jgi:hypothetical protein
LASVDTACRLRPSGTVNVSHAFKALCPNERVSNASSWRPGFVQAKDEDMRDFRDAKAMAHTLRAALAARDLKITISQSLELIAEAFGVADWNTLSAAIRAEAATPRQSASPPPPPLSIPASIAGSQFSAELESTLHRALAHANQRKHHYATLEHLLLALAGDVDASSVMKACNVDLDVVRASLVNYLETEFENLVADGGDEAKPTLAFQRVLQRAVFHVQEVGGHTVTGVQLLLGLFAEARSFSARLLAEQGATRFDVANFIAHGIAKGSGGAGRAE